MPQVHATAARLSFVVPGLAPRGAAVAEGWREGAGQMKGHSSITLGPQLA